MVKNLLNAFDKRIDALAWMSPATKTEAHAKLATLKVGVGYPDHWRDYSGLKVVKGDALGNAWRASLFDTHQKIARLGKPVDRGEWVMNPQLVNAVNLPVLNALNFPAAILQPPYFNPQSPDAVNYGSTGATIGHEVSHSFDNEGSQFDSHGRMRNWWTPADFAHFKASGDALAREFDTYHPFPDVAVNGQQTLGDRRRCSKALPATSSSSSPSPRAGATRYARRRCACGSPPTATPRRSIAATTCATTTPGTTPSTSNPARSSTWRPPTACGCGRLGNKTNRGMRPWD
jgi:predicted metalloendopeptidase